MRLYVFVLLLLFYSAHLWHPGQSRAGMGERAHEETPKLMVGIVIDQFRPDYIYRFRGNFDDGGFKRLVNDGHTFRNAWFSYLQTSTGPGHAVQLTGATGNFITSTFYMDELPGWLQEFNSRNLAQEYLTRTWDMLLPEEEYAKRSRPDDNPYEGTFSGMDRPTFPIDLAYLSENAGIGPGDLNRTPFSDELLTELAIAAIEGEQLGQRGVPDILAISYSATDAIGHRFGPAS